MLEEAEASHGTADILEMFPGLLEQVFKESVSGFRSSELLPVFQFQSDGDLSVFCRSFLLKPSNRTTCGVSTADPGFPVSHPDPRGLLLLSVLHLLCFRLCCGGSDPTWQQL